MADFDNAKAAEDKKKLESIRPDILKAMKREVGQSQKKAEQAKKEMQQLID